MGDFFFLWLATVMLQNVFSQILGKKNGLIRATNIKLISQNESFIRVWHLVFCRWIRIRRHYEYVTFSMKRCYYYCPLNANKSGNFTYCFIGDNDERNFKQVLHSKVFMWKGGRESRCGFYETRLTKSWWSLKQRDFTWRFIKNYCRL